MPRKKRRKVASRGSVNNIILKTLVNGDKYGYEIIKEVEEFSDGKIQLKQPSLYSSLSRFEDKKFVSSYWGDSDIGGRRHYYHLTELGLQYYRKSVLKEDVDEIDEDDNLDDDSEPDKNNDNNLDDYLLDNHDNNKISCNNNDINDEIESNNEISFDEDNKNENEIAEVFLDAHVEDGAEDIPTSFLSSISTNNILQDSQNDKTSTLYNSVRNNNDIDYQYQTPTPKINITEENNIDEIKNSDSSEVINDNECPWQELSDSVKKANAEISNTKFKTMYFKKPKKEYKVILDKDGIYKLREDSYIPDKQQKQVIIDNVGKRANPSNVYGYTSYTDYGKQKISGQKLYSELTDEEKRKRNESFLAKFNLITNSKMKTINTPTPKVEESKPEKVIDYRSKLNAIIESSYIEEDENDDNECENNLFNYDNVNNWNSNTNEAVIDDDEENFVDLEPIQEFETKSENKQYINEINNYSNPNHPIKLNKYETKPRAILVDKTFVLINKLRFAFGLILTLFMLSELTISYFIFKNSNLIFSSDKTLFIVAYCLVAVFAGICIIPYCFNTNQHKANNYKFKYAMWFGILTFIVLSILIYCINALSGFELDNFKYFAVKLIVPILLSFNFVIAPIIYEVLNKNKIFYD